MLESAMRSSAIVNVRRADIRFGNSADIRSHG